MRTLIVLAVLTIAIPVYGDLGQPNDIAPYGDFELDPQGTVLPTGWNSHWGDSGMIMSFAGSYSGDQCYGVGGGTGGIDILVENPEPDHWEKQIYVGGWFIQILPNVENRARFSLHMDPDPNVLPAGLDLYSPWYEDISTTVWNLREWYVSEVEPGVPLPCLDFTVNIEIEAGGMGSIWVDAVNVQHICIPEPACLSLLALGGLALLRRKRS